jgi:ABC-type oligopeptide transport system substrate-binding subunit
LDPTTITSADKIDALLEITAPDGTKTNVVTDDLGYCDLGAVAPGTYSVKPRYFAAAAKSFQVVAGQSTSAEVTTPQAGLGFYLFNPAKSPLDKLSVRQAHAAAVSRADVVTASGQIPVPAVAFSTVPQGLQGAWSAGLHLQAEDLNFAKTTLGTTVVAVGILYNNDGTSPNALQNMATAVQGQWQAISAKVTVTLVQQPWSTFLVTRDTNKDFQVAREGWILDSNNPLPFYETLSPILGNYSGFAALMTTATHDLSTKSFSAFDADLVALNDYLVDNALVVPLYNY